MFILDRRKMSPDNGDDGSTGSGASENPTPPSDDDSSPPPSSEPRKGGKVDQAVVDIYKKDMHKYKDRLREAEKRLKEYDDQKKADEEQKLLNEKNYQQLLENRDAEINELKGKHQELTSTIETFEKREIQGAKLQAFLDGADFKVDSKYMGYIDLDKIQINDGKIDETSVNHARELFVKEHPILVQRGTKIPSFGQPGPESNSAKVSRRQNLKDYVRDPRLSAQRAAKGLIE